VASSEPSIVDPTAPVRIGVMGAGAVGLYFGGRLRQGGTPVTVVARPVHVDAIRRDGLAIDSADAPATVALDAWDTPAPLARCDAVLVCVKSVDTDEVAAMLAGVVPRATLILSLQNGVDNAWRLRARMPQPVVPAVVYVSAEMAGPGRVRHNGSGRLILGAPLVDSAGEAEALRRLAAVEAALAMARGPTTRAADVRVELWTKLTANCAYNAISALTQLRYGRLAGDAGVRSVMDAVTDEIAAVAAADGVPVAREGLGQAVRAIAEAMPQALSSTAQDLAAGRRTEIDDLNGFVVRRGRALGVPTPVNDTLRALVKFVETTRTPA
jgi:2-dehydropantoate 2-reductase